MRIYILSLFTLKVDKSDVYLIDAVEFKWKIKAANFYCFLFVNISILIWIIWKIPKAIILSKLSGYKFFFLN